MPEPSGTTLVATLKSKWTSLRNSRRMLLLVVLALPVGAGVLTYSILSHRAAVAAQETASPTATVRQGELVLSASGSGTLAASDLIELAFTSSAEVTGVFVKPGDHVEAGTLLAQVDEQDAQNKYMKAKFAYENLTSAMAIADAQEQVVQAQYEVTSSILQLQYLISPKVYYWETEVEKGQADLQEAQAHLASSPDDVQAQDALEKAKAFFGFVQDSLKGAWEVYYDEYVPETFPIVEDRNDKDVYGTPSDLEIQQARTAIDEARKTLADSQELYDVLTGGAMPEVPISDGLVQLQQVKRDLLDAQDTLEGTEIIAPISGTILTVAVSKGNTAGTDTVITMADLSQLALDFFLDESDWGLAAVGEQVQITFDALPDQVFTGLVTQLDEELYQSGNSSVVHGVARLDSLPEGIDLPLGASGTIDVIHVRIENAVLVPLEALHEDASGEYTVNLAEDGSFTPRPVEIGLQDQFYAEVKSGLKAGDVVSISTGETK
jgi:HlyD family secretion protein